MAEPELVGEPLAAHAFVLVGRPDHPLAGPEQAPFAALAQEQLILPSDSVPLKSTILGLAAAAGIVLDVALEVSNVEAQIQAVASGVGISPLSTYCLAGAAAHLARLNVDGFPLRSEWLVVAPRGPLSAAASRVKQFLLDYCAGLSLQTT